MNYSNLYPTSSYITIMYDIIAVRRLIQISFLEFIHYYYVCHHVSQMTYLNLVQRVHTLLLCVSSCQSDELFETLSYEFTHYYYVCHHVSQMNFSNPYPTNSNITIMCAIMAVRQRIQIFSLEFKHYFTEQK